MGEVRDISLVSMLAVFSLLVIPSCVFVVLRMRLLKELLVSAVRMVVQLSLMGLYLRVLFKYDHPVVNILWLFVMIIVATFQVLRSSHLSRRLFLPILASYTVTIYAVTLFFNAFVVNLKEIFSAKYLIVIGGMILGNSLRGVILSTTDFYRSVEREAERLRYRLVMFGNTFEAILPFLAQSLELSLSPIVATMATMGIVSIPGMMTGQILGKADPIVAVKYQIAIIIAIFTAITMSVVLAIAASMRVAFDRWGNPRQARSEGKGP